MTATELPVGETGTVYFETRAATFEYHGDPTKTQAVQHPAHPTWRTLGDIGSVDEEGYLYLTDRKAFMIVSGGVNIYPQEIEDVLLAHPTSSTRRCSGSPTRRWAKRSRRSSSPLDGVEPG